MLWPMVLCLRFAALGVGGDCTDRSDARAEVVAFHAQTSAEWMMVIRCPTSECASKLRTNASKQGKVLLELPRHHPDVPIDAGGVQ